MIQRTTQLRNQREETAMLKTHEALRRFTSEEQRGAELGSPRNEHEIVLVEQTLRGPREISYSRNGDSASWDEFRELLFA